LSDINNGKIILMHIQTIPRNVKGDDAFQNNVNVSIKIIIFLNSCVRT